MNNGQKSGVGLPSYLQALSNLRSTVRRTIESAWDLERLAFEQRTLLELHGNETFQNHLSSLGFGRAVEPLEMSYSLDYTSRLLRPELTQNGAGKDFAVATVAMGEDFGDSVRPCLESHQAYGRQHGYDYARLVLTPHRMHRHPSWYKIPLVYQLLSLGYRHVFFVDADAMITNLEVPLPSFFDTLASDGSVLHVADDGDGVNMGVFFLRGVPDASRLLDLIWLYDLGNPVWEQAALKSLLTAYRQVRKVVSIAPDARAFNSFPKERGEQMKFAQDNNWMPGDFICHFSGLRNPLLAELINRYARDLRGSAP